MRNQVWSCQSRACFRKSLLLSFLSGERGIQKETVYPTGAQVRDCRTLWWPGTCLKGGLLQRRCGTSWRVLLGLSLILSFAHKMSDSSVHSRRTEIGQKRWPTDWPLLNKGFVRAKWNLPNPRGGPLVIFNQNVGQLDLATHVLLLLGNWSHQSSF